MSRLRLVPPGIGMTRPLRYGLLGMPLAFAALPLYVQWPAHAVAHWGLPLAGLGALLLAVRLADALIDPLVGRWADAAFARAPGRAWAMAGIASALTVAGVAALFLAPAPDAARPGAAWLWAGLLLAITSWAYGVAVVVHQSWAARLGGDVPTQARWVGAREGFTLAGVVAASVLPARLGWPLTAALLAALAFAAWLALGHERPPAEARRASPRGPGRPGTGPWHDAAFRSLLAVYAPQALAGAIPATLVMFFMRDVLRVDDRSAGWLLGLYFVAAAASVAGWVRFVGRFGLYAAWLAGTALAIVSFAGAGFLRAGDAWPFAAVCAASGFALGADLVVAPTLLAQLYRRDAGRRARADQGLWFGWWAMTGKLMLALAAGLALPLVQALGYRPGATTPDAAAALAIAYAWLPCAIKGLALLALVSQRGVLFGQPAGLARRGALGETT